MIQHCINCGFPNKYKIKAPFKLKSKCPNCRFSQVEFGSEFFLELFFFIGSKYVKNNIFNFVCIDKHENNISFLLYSQDILNHNCTKL